MNTVSNITDELSPITDEPDSRPLPTAKKARRSRQNTNLSNDISDAATFLHHLETNQELAALVLPLGIDANELQQGKLLHQTAQARFTQRQVAMGLEQQALSETKRLTALVRADYSRFREVTRVWVELPGGQEALGLRGRVPLDRQKLITQTRASYTAAGLPNYQPLLGRVGYGPSLLSGLLEDVSSLEVAIAASQSASSAAKRATQERDSATRALRQWVSRAKRLARRALIGYPELQSLLSLT